MDAAGRAHQREPFFDHAVEVAGLAEIAAARLIAKDLRNR